MFDFYSMYEFTNPKPVLEAEDLCGKDRKAYDALHPVSGIKVDRRRVKWARRYLKAHGYELISSQEADKLNAEYEKRKKISKIVIDKLFEKFPIFWVINGL